MRVLTNLGGLTASNVRSELWTVGMVALGIVLALAI